MTTADKLNKLLQTKEAIRLALIEKGQNATVSTPFADYANMILGITTEKPVLVSKNLVNMQEATLGNIDSDTGLDIDESWAFVLGKTNFIPVKEGVHSYSLTDTDLVVEKAFFYTEEKEFIKVQSLYSAGGQITVESDGFVRFVFLNAENDLEKVQNTKFQLEKGDVITPYEPFNHVPETNRPYVKPFPAVTNPIITTAIVSDRTGAQGVADPFIVNDNGRFHLFFEILGGKNPDTDVVTDEVAHAYSDDLINWTYTQVVLGQDTHGHRSAFPNVFKVDGEWYMLPDTGGNVRLYKATNFPLEWEMQLDLINGSFVDTTIFKQGDIWYILTSEISQGFKGITLYYNDSNDWKNTQWQTHPAGIIIADDESESWKRCAGNPILKNDGVLLPVQIMPSTTGMYGEYTRLMKIDNLSTSTVDVTDLGIFTNAMKDGGWASTSMHHISHTEYSGGKIFAVDGTSASVDYSIGLYVEE